METPEAVVEAISLFDAIDSTIERVERLCAVGLWTDEQRRALIDLEERLNEACDLARPAFPIPYFIAD